MYVSMYLCKKKKKEVKRKRERTFSYIITPNKIKINSNARY